MYESPAPLDLSPLMWHTNPQQFRVHRAVRSPSVRPTARSRHVAIARSRSINWLFSTPPIHSLASPMKATSPCFPRCLFRPARVGNARAPHLVLRWGGTSVLRAPLSTTGELGSQYGASTTRRKGLAAVPGATTGTPRVASQTKQNKTRRSSTSGWVLGAPKYCPVL